VVSVILFYSPTLQNIRSHFGFSFFNICAHFVCASI